jgi:hypothetical protein
MVKDDVFLVAGNLTSVSADVLEKWKKDVVDAILFSQLYASSKISKFTDSQRWYEKYTEAMSKTKWQTGGFRFSKIELDEGGTVVFNVLVQKRIGSVVGLPQAEQFEQLMCSIQQGYAAEAIASLPEDHAMVFQVNEKTSTVSTVVLHVILVGRGPAICSALVCFKTTQKIKRDFFHQEFKSELIVGDIEIGISELVLDRNAYEKARMREKILVSLPELTDPLVLDITAKDDDQVR